MQKQLHLVSLGCTKNLVDSEVMLGRLRDYEISDDATTAKALGGTFGAAYGMGSNDADTSKGDYTELDLTYKTKLTDDIHNVCCIRLH